MQDFPFDVKVEIASVCIASWNALMRVDRKFGRYAISPEGQARFAKIFTTVETVGGTTTWYLAGKRHRIGDLPAAINSQGARWWFQRGVLHRENDMPAAIFADGTRHWYWRGERHRGGNRPACKNVDDEPDEYYTHGKFIR